MNKFIHFSILILAISLFQIACKKDEVIVPGDDCVISANIDGQEFRWEVGNCSYNNQLLRVGDIGTDEAELTLEPVDNTGTFLSTDSNLKLTLFLTLNPTVQIFPADVQIVITSFSALEVEGTFEGIFTDINGTNYSVANGAFRAVI